MYKSTKKFGPISTNHRNWKAAENKNRDSVKCSWIHGYSRYIEFTFVGDYDECQWVMDFGDLKDVKALIEEAWDHKTLIASNDPRLGQIKHMRDAGLIALTVVDVSNGLGWGPGIEGSCKWAFDKVSELLVKKTDGRVGIESVRVWEHGNNSAYYFGNEDDYIRHGYSQEQIDSFFE